MWHQLKAGSKARSHVHDGDCEPIASTVSAFAFTECKQSGTPRPPRGKEGHDSPHTHPCDCDGLRPLDSPDSVWTRYLQHRSHSQHYGIALAGCPVKDVPTYRERYPIPRLIERGSLKKVIKRKGLTWVLRYRVGGREQAALVVGLVADFQSPRTASPRIIARQYLKACSEMCSMGAGLSGSGVPTTLANSSTSSM